MLDQEGREAMNQQAIDRCSGGCDPSYTEALMSILDRNESLRLPPNEEYLRGQLELVADLWPVRGVFTLDRVDEIKQDLLKVRDG